MRSLLSKNKPLHRLNKAELRNELIAARNVAATCKCRQCLDRIEYVEDLLKCREDEAPKPAKPNRRYDPLFLEMGIKKERQHQQTPEQRRQSGKMFSDLMKFSRTTEGIAREQGRLDRVRWARGQTVRG